MRPVVLVAAIAVAGFAAAPARGDFPAAIAAYDGGDYATAFAESVAVAARGDRDAQYLVGLLYSRGEGVALDRVRAYLWFSLAADQGDRFAMDALAGLARRMTAARIAEAEALARDWRPESND